MVTHSTQIVLTHIATPKNSCLAVDTTTSANLRTFQYSSLGKGPECSSLLPSREIVSLKQAVWKRCNQCPTQLRLKSSAIHVHALFQLMLQRQSTYCTVQVQIEYITAHSENMPLSWIARWTCLMLHSTLHVDLCSSAQFCTHTYMHLYLFSNAKC